MIDSDTGVSPPQACVKSTRCPSLYDSLFYVLLIVVGLLVLTTFKDYGISVDEGLQKDYGHLLFSFYASGLQDQRVFSYENLYYYGGLFDLISAALTHISPLAEYDTRHLLCALSGLLGIVGVWRVGRLVGGARVGLLAAVLLTITGAYYGAMFNNTKDVPFAAGMIWVVYFGCRLVAALPKPAYSLGIGFGAAIGLSLGVRVGALFGGIYVLPAILAHFAGLARSAGWPRAGAAMSVLAVRSLPGLAVAILLMALFWPWSVLAPGNIVAAVGALSSFNILTVVAGQSLTSADDPRWYLPAYMAAKLPEIVLLGSALAFFAAFIGCRSRSAAGALRLPTTYMWSVVILAAAVPVGYAVIARPALYNGLRHFLFVIPPLCVVAAAGIAWALRSARQLGRAAFFAVAAIAAAFMAKDLWTLVALHPHQYVYYNLLVGGVKGAAGRWEMDYWSNYAPEAFRSLVNRLKAENGGRLPDRPIAVTFCYPEWFPPWIFESYAPPPLVRSQEYCDDAEFYIATTNTGCAEACRGTTIVTVERLGAVLGVVKDLRALQPKISSPPDKQP